MSSVFHCDSCNKEISKTNKSKHLKSKKHINNVNNGFDEIKYHYHCDSCNEEIIRSNKARHEKTRKHLISSGTGLISLNSGGDIQTAVIKLPGFPWAKYPGEFHLPNYSYAGLGSAVPRWPISFIKESLLHHTYQPSNITPERLEANDDIEPACCS